MCEARWQGRAGHHRSTDGLVLVHHPPQNRPCYAVAAACPMPRATISRVSGTLYLFFGSGLAPAIAASQPFGRGNPPGNWRYATRHDARLAARTIIHLNHHRCTDYSVRPGFTIHHLLIDAAPAFASGNSTDRPKQYLVAGRGILLRACCFGKTKKSAASGALCPRANEVVLRIQRDQRRQVHR